jgi:RNA polymerase sigma factor (sigma-70 family)
MGKMTNDDMELVRQYAHNHSEEAFAELVARHLNLVYGVALRQLGATQLAEDVTQTTFIILARKAGSLRADTIVAAWLCRTAQLAAADARKMQRRRERRELETHMQNLSDAPQSESATWVELGPALDVAMGRLGQTDHSAIVLRFFEGKDVKEVATALGISPNAAKTRVSRALEKLRNFLKGRGITISAATLAAAITSHSSQAAPVGLAASVTVAAVHHITLTPSTFIILKSTLKTMAYTKLKTAVIGSALVLLLAGGTALVVHTISAEAGPSRADGNAGVPAFAGFATPEAALKSFIWAEGTGKLETLLAACTPQQAARFKQKIAGVPEPELRRRLMEEAKNRSDYEVTGKDIISDDEVRLHLQVQPYPGHPKVGNDVQVMQKIGNDWKYAGKYGVDIKEN